MSTFPISLESFGAATQKLCSKNKLALQNSVGVSCNHTRQCASLIDDIIYDLYVANRKFESILKCRSVSLPRCSSLLLMCYLGYEFFVHLWRKKNLCVLIQIIHRPRMKATSYSPVWSIVWCFGPGSSNSYPPVRFNLNGAR